MLQHGPTLKVYAKCRKPVTKTTYYMIEFMSRVGKSRDRKYISGCLGLVGGVGRNGGLRSDC